MRLNPKILLVLAIAACWGLSLLAHTPFFNAYHLDIVLGIGIHIILAVSLNLINGYTGQFSLGHAGFMGVGAYAASSVTLFLGPLLLSRFGSANVFGGVPAIVLMALFAGGVLAAIAGWLVGVPSLRFNGGYVAIVTLAFGDIIV